MSNERDPGHPDRVSDPARSDEVGADWADEGGATPDGPATAESATDGDPHRDDRGGQAPMGEDDSVSRTAEDIPLTSVTLDPPD